MVASADMCIFRAEWRRSFRMGDEYATYECREGPVTMFSDRETEDQEMAKEVK